MLSETIFAIRWKSEPKAVPENCKASNFDIALNFPKEAKLYIDMIFSSSLRIITRPWKTEFHKSDNNDTRSKLLICINLAQS